MGPPGIQGIQGLQGVPGVQGEPGPAGASATLEAFRMVIENDQGIIGNTISGTFQPTPIPASLTFTTTSPGTYLLTWYAEVMRTTAGGGSTFFARLRDVTGAATRGYLRDGSGVENGPPGAMPNDTDLFQQGDVLPFAGSMPVVLATGTQTYRLEYALSTNASASEALRARRQRITLLRLE